MVSEHPELVDELLSSADAEKDAILANPQLSAIFENAAEQIGITPREYLDHLEAVIEENPEKFYKMLHQQFKKEQEIYIDTSYEQP